MNKSKEANYSKSKSISLRQIPLETLKIIMHHVCGSRPRELLEDTDCGLIDAFSFCKAYPPLRGYFQESCETLYLDHCWPASEICDLAQLVAPSLRKLTLAANSLCWHFVQTLAPLRPSLVSLSLMFDTAKFVKEPEHLEHLLNGLSLIMISSLFTLRTLRIHPSPLDKKNNVTARVIREISPFLFGVTVLSLSGQNSLQKADVQALICAAGFSLRKLMLSNLSCDEIDGPVLVCVRKACPNVKAISIVGFGDDLCKKYEQFIKSYGANLLDLEFYTDFELDDGISFESVFHQCNRVKNFSTLLLDCVDVDMFYPIQDLRYSLESLVLRTSIGLDREALDYLYDDRPFPKLRSLRLNPDRDISDVLDALCTHFGSQLHVLEYLGTVSNKVLRAVAKCTNLRALFLGRDCDDVGCKEGDQVEKTSGDDLLMEKTSPMEDMFRSVGRTLEMFSIGGAEFKEAFDDEDLPERIEFDGSIMIASVLRHCTSLQVFHAYHVRNRFCSEERIKLAFRKLEVLMPQAHLYLNQTLPEGLHQKWIAT